MEDKLYTNFTLRIPVAQEVGQDVDFWMKKPSTLTQIRKGLRKALKERLSITRVPTVELDKFIHEWAVWDEMAVKVRKEGDLFESFLGLHIDEHLAIMENYATILASKNADELPEKNPVDGLIIVEETQIGSFKARCGISDIVAD